jgi:hypothetical protein
MALKSSYELVYPQRSEGLSGGDIQNITWTYASNMKVPVASIAFAYSNM